MSPNNTGNAILILGIFYIILNYELGWWTKFWLGVLTGLAIFTWTIYTKEDRENGRLQNENLKAGIRNMNAATAIAIANTKLIERQINGT